MLNLKDWAYSLLWERKPEETDEDYKNRLNAMKTDYQETKKTRGLPVLKKGKDKLISVDYNNDINWKAIKDKWTERRITTESIEGDDEYKDRINRLKKALKREGKIIYGFCPYCVQYTYGIDETEHKWTDEIINTEQTFFMRVLHHKYPEGFIDKGGVATQCGCVKLRKEILYDELFEKKETRKW